MRLALLVLVAFLLSGCSGSRLVRDLSSSGGSQVGTARTSAPGASTGVPVGVRGADAEDPAGTSASGTWTAEGGAGGMDSTGSEAGGAGDSSCPVIRVSWVDDAFAAGYPALGADAKAEFTVGPGFAAGEAAADPRWPPDGLVSSTTWVDGNGYGFLVQAKPAGAASLYESAPADSTVDEREAKGRAFLDAVAFEPAGDRGALAQRLATTGSIQHGDPAPGSPAPSSWYVATADAGSGSASADAIVPEVLENSTAGSSSSGDVEFSKALPDGLWKLRARVPKTVLTLQDGAEVTLDTLGRAFAWHGGQALPEAADLKGQVGAALRDHGLPGGSFGGWQPSWAC